MKTVLRWFKRLVVLAILGGIGYAAYAYFSARKQEGGTVRYRSAPFVKMDIFRTVEATGTVQPIKKVEVGAQVNGKIVKLFVDYNSVVTNGQVVALIDPQVYEANYKSALGELHANQANVKKCDAQLVLAEKTLARKKKLVDREMVPVADYDAALEARDTAIASLAAAKASVEKSEASVSQSRANLNYCTIVSPVNGVVITRSVDEGQTVVSSMNAVPLLNIATDLKRIQVEATVPEADIGSVREGQAVTFSVDSYPRIRFKGVVTQVRMASTTTSSVVTYPVIIQADNPGGKLFPGMTANISVHIAEAKDVLAVTAAAFRYHPADEEVRPRAPDSSEATVYLLESNAPPSKVDVKTGITDGSFTEIKAPTDLLGREAVLGVMVAEPVAAAQQPGQSNPFMPKRLSRPKKKNAQPPPPR